MYIVLWLIFGAIVGWLASILMNKNRSMGLLLNILFGLIGSALGMWLMDILGFGRVESFTLEGLFVSVVGAAILILIVTTIRRK